MYGTGSKPEPREGDIRTFSNTEVLEFKVKVFKGGQPLGMTMLEKKKKVTRMNLQNLSCGRISNRVLQSVSSHTVPLAWSSSAGDIQV